MPANKNAQYRYRVLNDCFRDSMHKYSFQDLLEKVNDRLLLPQITIFLNLDLIIPAQKFTPLIQY